MTWSNDFIFRALGVRPSPASFTDISTDTRTLQRGALFVALAGERFDGHDHLAKARDAGAEAAVVRKGTAPVAGLSLIEVEDTLKAYGDLARAHRRTITGPVIAITGSNGKTSTKEMAAAVLRTAFRTHATAANLNNLVGIPQTILAAPTDTEAMVIEAGANLPGEIARAREIIEPTIALITTVAESHLEGFGSIAGVLREKLALVQGVPLAIVGAEPLALADAAKQVARRVISAGVRNADVMPSQVAVTRDGQPTFTRDGVTTRLPLRGEHQVGNAMLVWALGRELHIPPAAMSQALSSLVLPGGRGELIHAGGFTIVHDAYNANPSSFRAAIATARAMRHDRRLVFVAGSMRELGPDSAQLHRDIAQALVTLDPEILAVVGDFVEPVEALRSKLTGQLVTADDAPALGPLLASQLRGDELIVLKASRGVALERILPSLGATGSHYDPAE
jgi:UDP-N-acetylmuramoyl-tripeptide--D-alanyl-D-alanine ligase